MGYAWVATRNITYGTPLVHRAFRDAKPEAERGRVLLVCEACFVPTRSRFMDTWPPSITVAVFTRRPVSCVRCLAEVAVPAVSAFQDVRIRGVRR